MKNKLIQGTSVEELSSLHKCRFEGALINMYYRTVKVFDRSIGISPSAIFCMASTEKSPPAIQTAKKTSLRKAQSIRNTGYNYAIVAYYLNY